MTRPKRRGMGRSLGARSAALLAAAVLVAGGMTVWSFTSQEAHAEEGRSAPADDFNGDGYADVVSGAPGGTVSGRAGAGYVAVMYGSPDGLDASHKKLVSRSTSGVPGWAVAKQGFGDTSSKGDLDDDGYSDLVIGSAEGTSGSVVLWGSASGLTGGTAIAEYGQAPQAGDFDGDGKADLALTGDAEASGDDPVTQPANLWKGPISRGGTPAERLDFMDESEWWGYDDDGAECTTNHRCVDGPDSISGPTVIKAAGDVNGDKREDIVVRQYEGEGASGNHVMLGSPMGFTTVDTPGDDGAVGVGDVDGDGYDDVVVGAYEGSEKVTVAYGTADGPSPTHVQSFDQSLPGFPGVQEEGDTGGSCVSVADMTGDGRAEVALGISGEDFGGLTDAGSVALLHGTVLGVTATGNQVVTQNTVGVPGAAEENDAFGSACALLDADGDGHRDLGVSSTAENASAGTVWSLRGSADGLTTTSTKAFGPGDVEGPVTEGLFGSYLR